MRIVDIIEKTIGISRYADPSIPTGDLTTSLVAVVVDGDAAGRSVGYGFASIGRYAQGGLIRERFARRLLDATPEQLITGDGAGLDPMRAWAVMMSGEKPGGHGERCVAVGALDMALWDAAAKIAGAPLYELLARRLGRDVVGDPIRVYASGGYPYPDNDLARLADEIGRFRDLGFGEAKIKIGRASLREDIRRIETAVEVLGGSDRLAVDAMNAYDTDTSPEAAAALAPLGLRWFEDICDPLDFATQAAVARSYPPPIAAGEALFADVEAALLDQHGGLRPGHDYLVFDPVHCYGVPGYLRIVERLTSTGWPRTAFWPHASHLFALHLVAALGLGGAEATPSAFHPFHGPPSALPVHAGTIAVPDAPGIGWELHPEAWHEFQSISADR